MSTDLPIIKIDKKKFKGKRIAIVKANFNADITDKMLALAVKVLESYGVKYDVFEVVGSFEIPYQIKKISQRRKKYDGFMAIGCLIKGQTDHYQYISQAVSLGLMELSLVLTKPISYAILNCHNYQQAKARVKNAELATLALLKII